MSGKITDTVSNGLAKALGIKKSYRDPLGAHADPVTRGESAFSVGTIDGVSYLEPEPTTKEWFQEITPSGRGIAMYFWNIFPFMSWITKYNWQWLVGDLVAGMSFDL